MKNKIPAHREGAESIAISQIEFDTETEAIEHFEIVKKRFQDINSWELFAGKEKAEFSLRDENGNLSIEIPKVGNYVTIKVPLLHNSDDEDLDWVKIEVCEREVSDHAETHYIRLRPTQKPGSSDDVIVHFLTDESTSNFIIRRLDRMIIAEVIARNELPNYEDQSILAKIRNKIVSFGGMVIGSKLQWEGLTDGLIKVEK